MNWVKATVLEIREHAFLAKTDLHDQVVFHTNKNYDLKVNDQIEILCDEVMTLSLPPQQTAYDVKKEKSMMRFNLMEMKDKFKGVFKKQDLEQLEALEKQLHFSKFDTDDALVLGTLLYNKAKPRGAVAIRITRESDQLPIFQIVMEPKTQRHLDFGEAKRQTVLYTKHCSMWPLVKECVDGGLDDLFTQDSPCLTGSGGFPIIVNDELVATIFVSGLHEGQDQLVLVEAISEFLNIEVPPYHGYIF